MHTLTQQPLALLRPQHAMHITQEPLSLLWPCRGTTLTSSSRWAWGWATAWAGGCCNPQAAQQCMHQLVVHATPSTCPCLLQHVLVAVALAGLLLSSWLLPPAAVAAQAIAAVNQPHLPPALPLPSTAMLQPRRHGFRGGGQRRGVPSLRPALPAAARVGQPAAAALGVDSRVPGRGAGPAEADRERCVGGLVGWLVLLYGWAGSSQPSTMARGWRCWHAQEVVRSGASTPLQGVGWLVVWR